MDAVVQERQGMAMSDPPKSAFKSTEGALFFAGATLAVLYCFQTFGTLRLNGDAVELLGIAASLADGNGLRSFGRASHFPPGYPALVAAFDNAGVASRWTLVGLNLLFMASGIAASYKLLRDSLALSHQVALILCGLIMLSFVMVKHVSLPQSDIVFFGFFMVSLLLLTKVRRPADGRIDRTLLLWACIVVAAAIAVRTAGIVLLPALAWVVWAPTLASVSWTRCATLAGLAGLAGLVALITLSRTMYASEMLGIYSGAGILSTVADNVRMHLIELGEVMINVPTSRVPVSEWVFVCVGGVLLAVIGCGLWYRRVAFGVLEVVVLGYGLMIFLWPYQNARFWIPVLPLLFGFGAVAVRQAAQVSVFRFGLLAMCGLYSLSGLAGLFYVTSIAFSGGQFPSRYGDGTLTKTYEAFLSGQPSAGQSAPAMYILCRYDGRASAACEAPISQ